MTAGRSNPLPGSGLIQNINRLIREKTLCEVALTEANGSFYCIIIDIQMVEFLVRLLESLQNFSAADFVKLAESFGAMGLRASKPDELDGLFEEMIACDKAVIADIIVDPDENVYPMIPAGAAHYEMKLGPDEDGDAGPSDNTMLNL